MNRKKSQNIIPICCCLLVLFVCPNLAYPKKSSDTNFVICGIIEGVTAGHIIISYQNESQIELTDTIYIQNSTFEYKGHVSHPTLARFTLANLSVTFYIEAKKMELQATKASFEKATLSGSSTNDESIVREKLYQNMVANNLTKNIREDSRKILFDADSSFIVTHPDSYLSLVLMDFYFSDFKYDFFSTIFECLNPQMKATDLGKKIKQKISLSAKSKPGIVTPDIIFENTEKESIKLSNLFSQHKYTLLDFWASWCLPCRNNASYLKALFSRYKNQDLTVVSISLDKDHKEWMTAIQEDNLDSWFHVRDIHQLVEQEAGIFSIPTFVLLNQKGQILGKFNGRWKGTSELDKTLEELLINDGRD